MSVSTVPYRLVSRRAVVRNSMEWSGRVLPKRVSLFACAAEASCRSRRKRPMRMVVNLYEDVSAG